MSKGPLDIGHGVSIEYVRWSPDRELNPQYADTPDVDKFGMIVYHTSPELGECQGFVTFEGPVQQKLGRKTTWTVESWDPLTISPSVLCKRCNHHGWIQNGKWVPA